MLLAPADIKLAQNLDQMEKTSSNTKKEVSCKNHHHYKHTFLQLLLIKASILAFLKETRQGKRE